MAKTPRYFVEYKKQDDKPAVKVDILTGWQLDNLLLSEKIRATIKKICMVDSEDYTPEEMMAARKFY